MLVLGMLRFSGCSHISHTEDTNGTDDYTLTTLTDEDFLKGHNSGISFMSMSSTVNESTTISIKKFSGITIMKHKIRASGENLIIQTNTALSSGNLRICVVRDNEEIVADIAINADDEILIENATGVYTIVIGGESANFSFTYSYQNENKKV